MHMATVEEVCRHEAGHAVVGYVYNDKRTVSEVIVEPGDHGWHGITYFGYDPGMPETISKLMNPCISSVAGADLTTRLKKYPNAFVQQWLKEEIAIAWAGQLAQPLKEPATDDDDRIARCVEQLTALGGTETRNDFEVLVRKCLAEHAAQVDEFTTKLLKSGTGDQRRCLNPANCVLKEIFTALLKTVQSDAQEPGPDIVSPSDQIILLQNPVKTGLPVSQNCSQNQVVKT
jgi:hypothetical protein